MDKDKLAELHRYDTRAQAQLSVHGTTPLAEELGSKNMPQYLRSPYIYYEKCVSELISPQDHVLELGAGLGRHTLALVKTGARVTATDISLNSLKLLEQRIVNAGWAGVRTLVADIEELPFADDSFDVVACAGSLSYGEPALVDAEIKRVLRPSGLLVCVDSLNHNPLYRLNRWIHYRRGARTKSTLLRMPDLARILRLSKGFANVQVHYFGAVTFAMPTVAKLCGEVRANAVSYFFDKNCFFKKAAFKFVLVASDFKKGSPMESNS